MTLVASTGTVDVLQRYKEQGVFKAIGIAGGPIELMTRYVETGAFDTVLTHNRYNLIVRAADSLIEAAARRNMAVLNAAIYAGGMLAKGSAAWGKFAYREAPPHIVQLVQRVETVCKQYNVPLAVAGLQFSLRDPRITSTIIGMTRPERVAETVALAQQPVPEELWTQINEIVREADLSIN